MAFPGKLVVIAEEVSGEVRKGSTQTIHAANELSGGDFRCIVIGESKSHAGEQAAAAGAKNVEFIALPNASDHNAESVARILAEAIGGEAVVLMSHSDLGADVGPRLASHLGGAYLAEVTDLTIEGDKPVFKRPIYAGKALERVEILTNAAVVTLRPNAFPTPEMAGGDGAQVVELTPKKPEDLKSLVREVVKKATDDGDIELTEADVIVSGGMGVGGPEGYKPLRELCKVLGAALGASRAAVHAGFIDPDHQVGQTGKTVSPGLYIACGISGAIQHQAGMRTSKCIVAINTDPGAPIFQLAHYGIVADLHEVVPIMTEEFRKVLGKG